MDNDSLQDMIAPAHLRPRAGYGTMAVMLPFSRIVRFYLGTVPDTEGRMIADIWQWSRSEIDASPHLVGPLRL